MSAERDKAHCRSCGGQRRHHILAKEDVEWEDEVNPVWSHDSWQILKCAGCDTITFRHLSAFSEDTDDEGCVITHREQFPPAPPRKPPEWVVDLWRCVPIQDFLFISRLINDIYAAMGLKAYALSAMGTRAIVDWLVTETVGDGKKPFARRLEKMRDGGYITPERFGTIYAAFDAGSAAAHRQHLPTEDQVSTMLDIMERLFYDLKVKAFHDAEERRASEELKRTVPSSPGTS